MIENLDFENEFGPHEGQIIADILEMSAIDNRYIYVRTRAELEHFINVFIESEFRFLHISFHRSTTSISMTLEEISHEELGNHLSRKLKYRKLFFICVCFSKTGLAGNIFPQSGAILSLVLTKPLTWTKFRFLKLLFIT